jgi:hypothetical protein
MLAFMVSLIRSVRVVSDKPRAPGPRCIGCGCDEHHACTDENGDPCHWVRLDPPLCSACADEGLSLDSRPPGYAAFVQGGGDA